MPLKLHFLPLFTILYLTLWGAPLQADNAKELERVRVNLTTLLPDSKVDSVRSTPVPGLFEVVLGPRIAYITGDGRFLIQGELIDLELRKSLTMPRLQELKLASVAALGEAKMLVYEPEEVKHTVTIFTDIDCAFCRKLHKNMENYLSRGIKIRYLLFPRAGRNSASYIKAVSVWCADDQKQAMTQAKVGQSVETAYCQHPIQEHMEVGTQMGVTGTPAMLLDTGDLLPSYLPADQLSAVLERLKGGRKALGATFRTDAGADGQ